MYTEREYKFISALFRLLKGEHKDYLELKDFIKTKFRPISNKEAFEMAYLYDKNWSEQGFSKDQEDVNKMSYEEYKNTMPWQVRAVMSITDDEDPDNYEFDGNNEVEHDGTTYRIFESYDDLEATAEDGSIVDDICSDSDPDPEYIYITDTDRRILAGEEADSRVDNMDDDEIISEMDLEDTLEEFESYNEKKEKLKELEQEFHDAETEEESERIQSQIEELESEIEDMGVSGTREEIIESAKEELRSTYYDQIYDELEDPVQYFVIDHGYYADLSELIENGPVQYDCDRFKEDYIRNADTESLVFAAGYSEWNEVQTEDHGYVYVVWY